MAALRIVVTIALLMRSGAAAADRLGRWAAPIAEASSRFSIPATWIRRVIEIESNGRQELDGRPIVSRAGAMGLMQLMPGTWRDMRSLLGLGSDPQDPRDNILAGSLYLRLLYDRFGYPGLFAAYNAGPSRYLAFLSGTRALPPETRAYLRRASDASGRFAGEWEPARSTLFEPARSSLDAIGLSVPAGAGWAATTPRLPIRTSALFVLLGSDRTAR